MSNEPLISSIPGLITTCLFLFILNIRWVQKTNATRAKLAVKRGFQITMNGAIRRAAIGTVLIALPLGHFFLRLTPPFNFVLAASHFLGLTIGHVIYCKNHKAP